MYISDISKFYSHILPTLVRIKSINWLEFIPCKIIRFFLLLLRNAGDKASTWHSLGPNITTLMIFFQSWLIVHQYSPIPPIQCNVLNFFECSHSWILKICATYYLGYQTDLEKKNLYKCRGTFIVIKSTWMSELLYYIPITTTTTYYYISMTSLLKHSDAS